jgi:CheY-like chemotaxis protein
MTGEEKRKLVVLEDDEIFAALIAAALEEEFEVVTGHNGLQGIALCLEGGVAAVVTDIGMPDLDGLSMLREFDRHPALSPIPVLVITATHFNRLSRAELSRFPQVKRILSKTKSIDQLAAEVRAVLAEAGT